MHALRVAAIVLMAWVPANLPVTAGLNPDPNPFLARTFVDVTPGADFQNGNYERRRDLFTNTSAQDLVLAGIRVVLLNPEDVGFADLEPVNVPAVVAAARATFPQYSFWGTSFWNNSSRIPPLNVPPVNWVFAEFPAPTFPFALAPGESFLLETVAHNDLFGPSNPPPERIGELVIGWRFLTMECGNGVLEDAEACDDGNDIDTDGCRNDCSLPLCGDSIVDAQNAETCDPPGAPAGAGGNDCRQDCTVCGDGVVDAGEECDDANASDTDLCRNDCTEVGVVTRNADGASSLAVTDVDGDGDLDVVSASRNDNKIAWYENIDTTGDGLGDAEIWVERLVTDQALDPRFVTAGRLGGPSGAVRLFSATALDDSVTSYVNIYGDGLTWVESRISGSVAGASSVHLADINEDGCNDVLATGAADGTVVWFADITCEGFNWSPANTIDDSLGGARAAVSALLDRNPSIDVLAVGFDANSVVAYLNAGGGTAFSPVLISNTAFGAMSIQAGDVDSDGDIDAVVASSGDDSVTWYENVDTGQQGGDGSTWAPHLVSNTVAGAAAVSAIDLDGDRDLDIIAAAADAGAVLWYENLAGDGSAWTAHSLRTSFQGASAVTAQDLNGDLQPDVLAASFDNDTVAWFQNTNGLFAGPCGNGELNTFETCDPPGIVAGGNGNLCRDDCTVCGDAIVDPGESCDDGNGVDIGDNCNNSCGLAGSEPANRSRPASRSRSRSSSRSR